MRDLSESLMVIPFLGPTSQGAGLANYTSAFDTWYGRSQANNMLIIVTIASTWAAAGVVIIQPYSSDDGSTKWGAHTDYTATLNQTSGLFHFVIEFKDFKRYVKIRYDVVTQTAVLAIVGILNRSRRESGTPQATVSNVTVTTSSSSCSCSCSSCSCSCSSSSSSSA